MSASPIAVLAPAPIRRSVTLAALGGLGGGLVWVASTAPGDLVGRLLLLSLGLAALGLGYATARATQRRLLLTPTGIFDDRGTVLARLEDIASVDSGIFALKPAGGLTIRLARPLPRGWAPGLWWRTRRRLGLGGVTRRIEAKLFAEHLSGLLAQRDQPRRGS